MSFASRVSFPSRAATLLCHDDWVEVTGSASLNTPYAIKPLIALFQQLVHAQRVQLLQLLVQRGAQGSRHPLQVAMRAAGRFGNNAVDQIQLE
ncbi:MAG: hypothetical protein MZV65_36420 [Chromatiales bacterium]|nr:hypothetical protein [Chromatiales bacterium]